MSVLGAVLLGIGIAVWGAGAVTIFIVQFLGLSAETTASRIGRSLFSAALWPLIAVALVVARRGS